MFAWFIGEFGSDTFREGFGVQGSVFLADGAEVFTDFIG